MRLFAKTFVVNLFFSDITSQNDNWVVEIKNGSNIKTGCSPFDRVFMFDKIISAGLITLF